MALIVTVRNVSDLAPTSDYEYTVMVGDGTERGSTVIAYGTITGHRRAEGWMTLIAAVLDNELGRTLYER